MNDRKRFQQIGWKEHSLRHGDGSNGWLCEPAEHRFLHHQEGGWVLAFGLAQMDNGEVILLGAWEPVKGEKPHAVVAWSTDGGDMWSDFEAIPDAFQRPQLMAYLGAGNLAFSASEEQDNLAYFSSDYGRTWPERVPKQMAPNGRPLWGEGNPWVDRDAQGMATRVAMIGYNYVKGTWGAEPCDAFFCQSDDGARTWGEVIQPEAWRWQVDGEGKTWTRSICEGSVIRARNGWLIAALRNDLLPKFFPCHSDNFCGTGFSISKDDGRTWSPFKQLFEAGRMHANLVLMPNDDIVMTLIVRQDIRDGKLASFRKGCDALVSHDNGLTWDLDRRYILDDWPYYDYTRPVPHARAICGHSCSTLLEDGRILSAYGHYPAQGIGMIRWTPRLRSSGSA